MTPGMDIAFFGSSLLSAYWNGAATYYRGIIKALHRRGHRVTFYEPDAYERQSHRDIDEPEWARVVVYGADRRSAERALARARSADVVIKASGVGVNDALLEAGVLAQRRSGGVAVFWDVDAPATLERLEASRADPFRPLVRQYDLVITYGGGRPVRDAYVALGARQCVAIYNGFDPETHHPVAPEPRFHADLGFLGNRLPDRERRVERLFLEVAAGEPRMRFSLGGSGWGDKGLPGNVTYHGHVYTRDHNAFNCSARAVLNVARDSMARFGFSPATRVFEAAGAGACLISDEWDGMELFFEPGREVLVAADGGEVADLLASLSWREAAAIGRRARQRALAHHTYTERAAKVEAVLTGQAEVARA